MASKDDPRQARVDKHIDQNLKKVFSDLERDQLPNEITELLSTLRTQDIDQNVRK